MSIVAVAKPVAEGITFGDYLNRRLQDQAFRAEWERTAYARGVALWLVAYRAEHDLTQAQLAARLGMKQPQVARLEDGESEPRFATLQRIATALGEPLEIRLTPAGHNGAPCCQVEVASPAR